MEIETIHSVRNNCATDLLPSFDAKVLSFLLILSILSILSKVFWVKAVMTDSSRPQVYELKLTGMGESRNPVLFQLLNAWSPASAGVT